MHLLVRPATIHDAALIADLSRETFRETFAPYNTAADMEAFMREQFTREALITEVGAAGNTFFIAWDGDEAVGYARIYESKDDAAQKKMEIARIYAKASAIGKGVGKRLMQTCIEFAQAQGKKYVWLGVWEKNDRAIQFYTAWGFEKVGVHDFRLGTDIQHDWIMEKKL